MNPPANFAQSVFEELGLAESIETPSPTSTAKLYYIRNKKDYGRGYYLSAAGIDALIKHLETRKKELA